MNKLQQIANDLKDNPTLYDYYSYSKPWTLNELNQLMLAEYLTDVKELATEMNRSEYSVILKYLELREDTGNKLQFDAFVKPNIDSADFMNVNDYDIADFNEDVSIIYCKVNDEVRVNVRLTDESLRANPPSSMNSQLSHFMTIPAENGAGGHLYAGTMTTHYPELQDPDKWGFIKFHAQGVPGRILIGMEIKENADDVEGIKKTMLVVVE